MSGDYQGGHPEPENLWEKGGQSPDAYKNSPDARPDKKPISELFNTPDARHTVFTGSRVKFASGANGQMAVEIDDPMSPSQQYGGFDGIPWIAYALSADGLGYDGAVGANTVGNVTTAPAALEQLFLEAKNATADLVLKNIAGGDLKLFLQDLSGGGSVNISGRAADTLGLNIGYITIRDGCGARALVLGAFY